MKKLLNHLCFVMLAITIPAAFTACGGSHDDDITPPKIIPDGPNDNGSDNSGSNNTWQITQTCTTCDGSTDCTTCHGTGKGCKTCNGSGKYCKSCNSTGECDTCDGTGKCFRCDGIGKVDCSHCSNHKYPGYCGGCNGVGWVIKPEWPCGACGGYKFCFYCDGKYQFAEKCYTCNGKMVCQDCKDPNGRCGVCKGDPSCKTCGGDGHCASCINSDGKCRTCSGKGEIDGSLLNFSTSGGSIKLFIRCNTSWQVEKDADWISLSSTSGNGNSTLTVTGEANNNTSARNGIISFIIGKNKVDVNVAQSPEEPYVTFSPSELDFDISGGSKTISIASNTDWVAYITDDWLQITPSAGNRNETMTITATVNEGVERNAYVTFLYEGKSTQFKVKQEGYYLTLTEYSMDIKALGARKKVKVTSNSEWVAWTDSEWITLSEYWAPGSADIDINIGSNKTSYSRSGTVTFSSKAGLQTVNIKQAAGTSSPFLITNVEFAAFDNNGNIIGDYSKNPYFNRFSTKDVGARITCECFVSGSYTISVKVISAEGNTFPLGNIYTYMTEGEEYTYTSNRARFEEGYTTLRYYSPGKYNFEFYYNNQKIASGVYNVEY